MTMLFINISINEIRRLWLQPFVWVILGIIFFILAMMFLVLLNNFYAEVQVKFTGLKNAPGLTDTVFAPMFFWYALIGALMMPLFTMRLLTEEKVRHQFVLLSSAPVAPYIIVLSKMLALVTVILAFALLSFMFPLSIAKFTNLDWGKIFAAVLGVCLFQGSYAAICLWLASCTQNLLFAVLSSLGALFLLFVLFISGASTDESSLFTYLSNFAHFLPALSGLLSSQDIFYYVIITALFICLATIRLRYKRG